MLEFLLCIVTEAVSFTISIFGLLVSLVVLYITFQTWKLKIGQSARASYGITSSIEADGTYISNVIIQNLKDKDLIIFGIYLRFGYNIYIDLLNINDHYDKYHHIIPPLSTRVFELGAPVYYLRGVCEISIDDYFFRNYPKASIILLTNEGKLKASRFKKGWSPIVESFSNYSVLNIIPIRYYAKDSVVDTHEHTENYIDYASIEKTTLYVIRLKLNDNKEYEFKINPNFKYKYFKNIDFDEEVVSSKDALRAYLLKCKDDGLINFVEIISIIDFQQWITNSKSNLAKRIISEDKIKPLNWFEFHIIAKIETMIVKFKEPTYPSKLYSFYCFLGIKQNRNKKKNNI